MTAKSAICWTRRTRRPAAFFAEHMQQLHTVAGALIEREKLTGAEFQTLMQGGTLPPADAPRAKVKPVPVGTQPVQRTPAARRPEAAERGQAPAQAEAVGPGPQESGAAQAARCAGRHTAGRPAISGNACILASE